VTSAQRLPNRISSFILFAAVSGAPFPFGSVDPPAIAFWCVALGLAIVMASPRPFRSNYIPLLVLVLAIMLGYAFVLHEQLSAHPWIAVPNPLWNEAAKALGSQINPVVSIARNQPFFALGAALANILAVVCSFIICLDRQRARQLILVIAWSGVGYALFGIATYFLDPTQLLWREKLAYRDVLTSTFSSRNTAAVYFGSCAVLWLLLLSRQIRKRLPDGLPHWTRLTQMVLFGFPRPILIPLAMLILCLVAMLMTNSRAGIGISLIIFVMTVAAYFRRAMSGRGVMVSTLAGGAVIALVVLQVLGGNVSSRFDIEGLSGEGRFETYHSTLRMIADHPWFGTGLGTFVWSFPPYRTGTLSTWGIWDRAHSTPLELASDLGVPLTALIIFAWLIVLGVLIRGVMVRRRDLIVPVAAFSVATLALGHSCIDFSLQIPGYSIVVFALVGAGIAQSFPSNDAEGVSINTHKISDFPDVVAQSRT
jgi:O-antigen ligase